FVYVFSTGPVLDSIKLSGKVIDAVTLKPAATSWVMLYPLGEDSAVYKRKPDYIGKVDKDGKWTISYLRADSFNVVALKDENLNFIYDQDSELIGFLEKPIYTGDSTGVLQDIYLFPTIKRTGVSEVIIVADGWLKLVVNAQGEKPFPLFTPAIDTIATRWDGDTLNIWYPRAKAYAGKVILGTDTTNIRASTAEPVNNPKIKLAQPSPRIHPNGNVNFKSEVPLKEIDSDKIELRIDSSALLPFTIERSTQDARIFTIESDLVESARYFITFLPGALTDIWDRQNDTIRSSVVINALDQYGDLTMVIQGLDSTQQYVIRLKDGENLVDIFVVENIKETTIKRNALPPAKYTIEIIEDRNRNGIWDTGEYSVRRPAELKMTFATDPLRAGWELEAKMVWKAGSSTN
ncbi:MAG: hypothetical protein M3R25_14940, partial [Bacteroidota bacterium]|nr:hypothetical protein [Bacteroidota bacterium]